MAKSKVAFGIFMCACDVTCSGFIWYLLKANLRLPIRQGRSRAIIQLFMPIAIGIINYFCVYFTTNEIIV